ATVAEFQRKGYIPALDGDGWDHEQIHRFMGALEARRRWQSGSPIHRCKKSAAQLDFETAQRESNQEYLKDLDKYTLEDLLVMLTTGEPLGLRECFLVAVRQKLERLEFRE